ncbi:MAG: hypothetical protein VKL42_02270 [Snowella sp.]|nr:hypothetical protein [Snowella sp.]
MSNSQHNITLYANNRDTIGAEYHSVVILREDNATCCITRGLKFKQSIWQLDKILPNNYQLSSQLLEKIDSDLHHNFCLLLSRDVYSEGDSQPLFNYLLARQAEFTTEFWQMMAKWFADEQKHYEALRRVFRLIAGVSFTEMNQAFAQRSHEIEPIQAILTDEFTILVALLFDELGSTISYRRDLWEFYRHYGPAIARIGKQLVIDEGIHFQNAVQLIKNKHGDRLREIPDLLQQIAQLETSLGRYCKTFFLDHAQEQFRFPSNFNEVIIQMILAQFGLAHYPEKTNQLWQWKPESLDFVPIVTGCH